MHMHSSAIFNVAVKRTTMLATIFITLHFFSNINSQQMSYRVYSRSEAAFKIVNYTDSTERSNIYESMKMYGMPNAVNTPNSKNLDKNSDENSGNWSTPEECARQCSKGEPPKICYYHWTAELYRTMGSACDLCHPKTNTSLTTDCQCILADGVELSGIMVINRMYPGPSIQICLGDLVVIDVLNHAIGTGLTIHFHGLYQNGYQYYDGVPFVTQCPITYRSTFRYKWRALNSGTHFYHAHTGLHKPDGIEGAIVVRQPPEDDPSSKYYDEDGIDNVIFINDWFHDNPVDHWPGNQLSSPHWGQIPENFLINGRGQWFNETSNAYTNIPHAVINVKPNRRYRFRMINSLSWTCPVQMTIQNHNVSLIATDGEPILPKKVTTITSFSAERYDFILHTNKKSGTYWIQLRGLEKCEFREIGQLAILRYTDSPLTEPEEPRPLYKPGLARGIVFNDLNEVCEGSKRNQICAKNLRNEYEMPQRLTKDVDITIYIPFKFYVYRNEEIFKPNTYKNFQVPVGDLADVALLQNISNEFGASPYISQMDDISPERICSGDTLPEICQRERPCFCSHIIHLPLNSTVEIIMIDESPSGLAHPFHLHGFGFRVVGQGRFPKPYSEEGTSKEEAIQLDREGYLKRNLDSPPVKDTLASPTGGYTIVRFIADNPGYWLYHCHFQTHLLVGMELVFHVGEQSDLPPIPEGFPKCGNFQPKVHNWD